MKILLAEDEVALAKPLVTILEHSGYEVTHVENGEDAVNMAKASMYDCMVFDIMMPVMDGIEALTLIREAGDKTPVILLTAKAEIDDRITGLDAGADDYLTKPFAMGELLARIRSLTRRNKTYTSKNLSYGNVSLNIDDQELKREDAIRLPGREARLMEVFMLNPEKTLGFEEIYSKVWKDGESGEKAENSKSNKNDKSDKIEENGDAANNAEEEGNPKDVVWMYVSLLRGKLKAIDADIFIEDEEGEEFKLVRMSQ